MPSAPRGDELSADGDYDESYDRKPDRRRVGARLLLGLPHLLGLQEGVVPRRTHEVDDGGRESY